MSNTSQEPQQFAIERDGLTIAGFDWGGDGPALLFLHPNGFCAGFFDPLARRLTDSFRPVGVDLRAHGASDEPPDPAGYAYRVMAADVLAVLDHLGIAEIVVVGQSLGGGVAIVVDELAPGRITRALLCEPIAFGPELFAERPPGTGPGDGGNFMSEIARKRQAVWPDRETVRASYASRPPLDVLEPEALDAYIRWGFVDRPDGQVELACRPEAEATLFERSGEPDGAPAAWDHLPELRARTTIAAGEGSNLPVPWFSAQAERADAHYIEVAGGHFFLQEDTAEAERLVRERLS
jgi:pimeloyl-ACP methyl ester carboxylesterase